jgi:hypothetical protein
MVAPLALDLEIAPRKSLLDKTTSFDQGKGRTIARLDIGFDPMQQQFSKRIG